MAMTSAPVATVRDMHKLVVGWREWVGLPDLTAGPIRAKVDTGARTSAVHARSLSFHQHDGRTFASFVVGEPADDEQPTTAEVVEERAIRSSNGIEEIRPVVIVDIVLGESSWPIELTLTDRQLMGFPMLLGRSALRNRCVIDPNRSYCAGLPLLRDTDDFTHHQVSRLTQ